MTLIKRTLLFACLGLVACSAYRNSGRKNFEASTPGQVHLTSFDQLTNEQKMNSGNCWQQPANEPLWFSDTSLSVRKINSDDIEVCRVDDED